MQRLSTTIIDLVPKSLVAARLHNNIYRKSNKYSEISIKKTWGIFLKSPTKYTTITFMLVKLIVNTEYKLLFCETGCHVLNLWNCLD